MSEPRMPVAAAALATTVGVAAACWLLAARQMAGMDMGVETELGSFRFFLGAWVSMMAAMMLPGALPGVLRRLHARGRPGVVLAFPLSYLAVWTLVGLLVYALYRPHGTAVAGALTIAAGLYELTPFKRGCRRRCRERALSGPGFGVACVGSSLGLMLVLLALGAMSLTWMCVVAVLACVQKVLPPRARIDVPLALAFVALGVLVVVAPGVVPGVGPSM